MHYDLLQKYIFFCLQIWLFHFVIGLNWAVNLLHCITAWIHQVYICTCATLFGVLYLYFSIGYFLYFTLPVLEL